MKLRNFFGLAAIANLFGNLAVGIDYGKSAAPRGNRRRYPSKYSPLRGASAFPKTRKREEERRGRQHARNEANRAKRLARASK